MRKWIFQSQSLSEKKYKKLQQLKLPNLEKDYLVAYEPRNQDNVDSSDVVRDVSVKTSQKEN